MRLCARWPLTKLGWNRVEVSTQQHIISCKISETVQDRTKVTITIAVDANSPEEQSISRQITRRSDLKVETTEPYSYEKSKDTLIMIPSSNIAMINMSFINSSVKIKGVYS